MDDELLIPYYARHINEVMYKSKSTDTQELIKKDPQLFEEVRDTLER